MSPSIPHVIADRYRLVSPLGQGGMGRVWRATDEVLHRDVAIKELVPPPGLTPEERQEMRERSLREARAIARLNNSNVVRVFDVLSTDADPWIVMEYVPSRSLQDVLASDGPVSPTRAAEIGLGVLGALRAAHRAGVVHRDVKPGNVLLGDEGRVVLTDFGLAIIPGDPNVTRTGLVLGSPAYIAPERARDGTAGPQADLWSLGATLYAAVEGQSPYARSSAIATLAALATEPPPPAKNAGPLKAVLNGLLRKDPAERLGAVEAERLLIRAAGRKSRAGIAMSPTLRRPGIGRGRDAAPPVVPGPRPPESSATATAPSPSPVYVPGKAAVTSTSGAALAAAGAAAAAAAPVAPPQPATGPDADAPTRVETPAAVEAQAPTEAPVEAEAPTKVEPPVPATEPPTRVDVAASPVDAPAEVDAPETAEPETAAASGGTAEPETAAAAGAAAAPEKPAAPATKGKKHKNKAARVKAAAAGAGIAAGQAAASGTTGADAPTVSMPEPATRPEQPAATPVTATGQKPDAPAKPPGPAPQRLSVAQQAAARQRAAMPPATAHPVPPKQGDRRRTWLIAAVAAAVVLALAVIIPLVNRDDDADRPQGAGQSPAGGPAATTAAPVNPPAGSPGTSAPGAVVPTAPATTQPPATQAPTPPAPSAGAGGDALPALPAGWRTYTDTQYGYSVPVPAGWSVTRDGTRVNFRERGGGGRLLIIDQTRRPKADPVADWRQQEAARRAGYRNYERITIEAVDYWTKAADWEFRYTSDSGNRLHVRNRGFITAPDQAYSIYWSTLDAQWAANQDEFNLIAARFQPARR